MAKLKARGRDVVFKVEKTIPGKSAGVASATHYRMLASDGNVLSRHVVHYTSEEIAKNYGKRSHDYGWKVEGRAKRGLGLEELLKNYLDRGWQLMSASPSYFDVRGDSISALSSEPFISEEKAKRREEKLASGRAKAAEKRAQLSAKNDGPGFYVTNEYTGSLIRHRIADHERPFATLDEAVDFAQKRYVRFVQDFDFRYLLPIVVIEAASRDDAMLNAGHVWWINCDMKGPPVDPRQERFAF